MLFKNNTCFVPKRASGRLKAVKTFLSIRKLTFTNKFIFVYGTVNEIYLCWIYPQKHPKNQTEGVLFQSNISSFWLFWNNQWFINSKSCQCSNCHASNISFQVLYRTYGVWFSAVRSVVSVFLPRFNAPRFHDTKRKETFQNIRWLINGQF